MYKIACGMDGIPFFTYLSPIYYNADFSPGFGHHAILFVLVYLENHKSSDFNFKMASSNMQTYEYAMANAIPNHIQHYLS